MTAKNARVFRGTISTLFTTLVAPITVGLVIHTTQPAEKPTDDPVPAAGRPHAGGQDIGWTRAGLRRDVGGNGPRTIAARDVDAWLWDRDGPALADAALRGPRVVLGQTGLGRLQDWPGGEPFYQETVTVTVVRKALAERSPAAGR
jgi:hypothetical protein